MSKGFSGLFKDTRGYIVALGEDVLVRYMPNGDKNIDFSKLPGLNGIQVKKRLTDAQMLFLTNEYGVEFAQVYERGPGKGGRGGKYMIYSGTENTVDIPVNRNTILLNHTHPNGSMRPSHKDIKLMVLLKRVGSPQNFSTILPLGKNPVKFTKEGLKE